MRFAFPWAKRHHVHSQAVFLGNYEVCAGCGHLLLVGHTSVRRVEVRIGGTVNHEFYSKSCEPGYDRREMMLDGKWIYYRAVREVGRGTEDDDIIGWVKVSEDDVRNKEKNEPQTILRDAPPRQGMHLGSEAASTSG